MQLALTEDEAAFRDELRTFYTTKIPAEIRERTRSGEASTATTSPPATRSSTRTGWRYRLAGRMGR